MELKKLDFNNMDDKTKGMVKMGAIIGGIFIFFVVIMIIFKVIVGDVLPFSKIENIMINSTKKYVKNHPEKLDGGVYGTIEVKISDLIAEGYMKDMSKYTKKDVSCKGSVLIFKNLENYSYSPKLDCGKAYKYKLLTDEITKKENIVTEDIGLYKVETENPYYVYRGENVDNYVTLGETTWRIMKVDNNGNIKLFQDDSNNNVVWDNRYNLERKFNSGINEFEGTQASRLKDEIMALYNDEKILTKDIKSLIVPQEFCVEKRSDEDINNTGAIECSKKSELMGAGTISLNEYFEASIDPNCFGIATPSCKNYNYLATYKKPYWTLTATSKNTYQAYKIINNPIALNASSYGETHLVITVNGNINYSKGNGTKEDPYIINPTV